MNPANNAPETPENLGAEELSRSFQEQHPWDTDVDDVPLAAPAAETLNGADVAANASGEPQPAVPPPALRIAEAMLFVGGAPLTAARACEIVRGLTAEQFHQAIDNLNQDYRRQGRPYVIQSQGQGYVLVLRPRFRQVLELLYGTAREARLSPAAIDVLALVAYRQPATKQEIDSLRGAESANLLRQLVRRGLIAVVQRGEAGQREVTYGTTARFLELFKLQSLDDLPKTQDLQIL